MKRVMSRAAHALIASLFALPATHLHAQSYPVKPIRFIVPYAPGGSTDVVFRILAPRLTEILGQQVIIDNRPGAASTIGLEIVAKSPPDGYTVGINNIAYGANPAIYKKMPFDSEKDFAPVTLVSIVTLVATVHPSVPARSIKAFIALAKSQPGTLTYGSAGNGSANHLATERFAHMAGIKLVHVPYKGGGPAVISIVQGETSTLLAT
ncbi:MAG: tripartite tricarboxylate transporter substrate-binding protein, partial [Pseudomonadota bacterium]